jgi:hypothetical protein
MQTRILTLTAAMLLALAAAVGVSASVFVPDPPVQVSGLSPFAPGCDPGQTGTVYVNSEVEPWIDVNPANSGNLVGIWQQDRWSNGGARGLVAGVSFNGGSTWQQVVIPGISKCSGGIYDRSTDPWVTFGPGGNLYQLALSFNDFIPPLTEGPGGDFDHALLASRSTNGGLTWSAPVAVIRDLDANVFNDKQSITADPMRAGTVYAVWDRLVFPTSERASIIAGFRSSAFRGPTWFARTTNGGASWEPAREIYDPGQNDQTIGNQIVVLPNGTLVNIFTEFNNENAKKNRGGLVRVMRSTNAGQTWSGPITVSRLGTIGVRDPETGHDVRTGDIIPDIAVDRVTGTLYAAWQDARFNGGQADGIALSTSTDGGLSWSEPIKVNKTPTGIPIGNQQAFTPSVHVANGTVGVTYYDFRNNTPDPATLLTDTFIVHCHGACASAVGWAPPDAKLTVAPFDMSDAPDAGGYFTGDYMGLTAIGGEFGAFFSMPHAPADPSSAFFSRVGP